MTDFKYVPVIDVHQDNLTEIWPTLMLAVKNATFIGLDLELSGLGNRKKVNARCMDERFAGISDCAKTRSVLSVGVSCFQLQTLPTMGIASENASKTTRRLSFIVQTFNILVLCSEDYVVEPRSLRFLVEHGFDFNKQYALGISYYRGIDQAGADRDSMRQLFGSIVLHAKPVIFHNGLIDLIFLYHNFYTTLPSSLATFLADLSEILSGGVYDTKYISEFQARLPASYLQYVFRRGQRDNQSSGETESGPCVEIKYLPYPAACTYINYLPCAQTQANADNTTPLCRQYASHGWCNKGKSCTESHDVDLALDFDSSAVSKRRNRRNRKRKRSTKQEDMDVSHKGEKQSDKVESESSHEMDVDEKLSEKDQEDCSEDDSDEEENSVNEGKDDDDASSVRTSAENKVEVSDDSSEGDATSSRYNSSQKSDDVNSSSSPVKINSVPADSTSSVLPSKVASTNGTSETNTGKSKSSKPKPTRTDGHRAGFDAFMTGFIFAWYIAQHGSVSSLLSRGDTNCLGMDRFLNKVTLCGKDVPLQILKSNFTKTSKLHREKMQHLREAKT